MTLSVLMLQAVPAKDAPATGTTAPGAPAAPASPPPNPLMTFLPLIILAPLFFMMFRRQKKEAAARGSLKRGDKVVTQAGLIGELMEIDDRVAKVKIAPGTTVSVLANTLGPFETAKEKAAASKTDKTIEASK